MKQYLDLLKDINENGRFKGDRTGTGTISVFGRQMKFDLTKGLPVVTTKKIHLKSVIHELLWMISGDTNIKYLNDNGVRIWNEWADTNGDLGPVYGAQWRNWNNEGIDQLQNAIERLKTNPTCRRIIVNSWNPSVLPDTSKSFDENVANGNAALPPCHAFFQFHTYDLSETERGQILKDRWPVVFNETSPSNLKSECDAHNVPTLGLNMLMYQRSADTFLGVPFNVTFYAILQEIVAKECNMIASEFTHVFGDTHVYSNHKEQVELQLSRETRDLPKLVLSPRVDSIFDYEFDDIQITGYDPHPLIKGAVSV